MTIGVDVQAGPLELMAQIGIELGRMNDHADQDRLKELRRREWLRARVPIDVTLNAVGTVPTPTARCALNIGGPDAGYYWLVRRITAGGLTIKTSFAGTAEVYVTALTGTQGTIVTGPIITALQLIDCVDTNTTFPFVHFYSNRQLIVNANQNLMILADSATQALQFTAAAQIEVHRTVAEGSETEYGA